MKTKPFDYLAYLDTPQRLVAYIKEQEAEIERLRAAPREAVRRIVERCREANPFHMHAPASGATVMEWLLEELTAVAEVERDKMQCNHWECEKEELMDRIATERERCAQVADTAGDDESPEKIAARIRALEDKP